MQGQSERFFNGFKWMRILEDENDADLEAATNTDDNVDNVMKVNEESSSTSASYAAGCIWRWQVQNLEILIAARLQ